MMDYNIMALLMRVFFVFFCDEESKRKEIDRTLVRDDVKFSFSIISSYFKSSPTYSYVVR